VELTPFAVQAGRACSGHGDLALALAAEFGAPLAGADAALATSLIRCGRSATPAPPSS
jgi:hypothetical protein